MLKTLIIAGAAALIATAAQAQYRTYGSDSNSQSHSVGGYTTSRGTYVQPHQATNPNSTQMDNYGSGGNYKDEIGLPVTLLTPCNNPHSSLRHVATEVRRIKPYLGPCQFPEVMKDVDGDDIVKPSDW